jgi:hypothetical protein
MLIGIQLVNCTGNRVLKVASDIKNKIFQLISYLP